MTGASWRAFLIGAVLALIGGPATGQSARPVEVALPEAGPVVRTLELTGSFTARRAADLSPRVAGLVAEIAADAGDRVEAGDVILRLDERLAELAVDEAQALATERRAALAEAERLLDETGRLRERDFVPETQLEARRSEVAIAAAALSRAESALATARERLERHALVAPFGGVVATRTVEVGEWVETGAAVVRLVDIDSLWLDVRAPQGRWGDLGGEISVRAVVDALPGRTFDARVHRRVPVADPNARTFLVRLVTENDAGAITPGMSARARFDVVGDGEVLRVPRDAVIRYPDGTTTVWVVDRGSDTPVARELEVTLGATVGDAVEIVAGMDRPQPVIVRGNEVLGDGDPVRVLGGGASR